MHFSPRVSVLSRCAFLSAAVVFANGCATTKPTTMEISPDKLMVTGHVIGGQQPVSGSTIQLYAAGTGGDGTAATPLLAAPVTTDANGVFNITGMYLCPTAATQVYLLASGGDPGVGSSNGNIALMLALGPCGNLSVNTSVVVNELTTVASVWALAQYMTSSTSVASSTTDIAAINAAFAAVNQAVDPTTGISPGPAMSSNSTIQPAMLNTLADLLSECVNSTTAVAGDSSTCGKIMGYTADNNITPANTIDVGLQTAKNPSLNVAALFNLLISQVPFQPVLTTGPAAWLVPLATVTPTPAISPVGGTYTSAQTVTITESLSGAVIYYTLDGTTPTTKSSVYTPGQTVSVSANSMLKAMAIAPNYGGSPVQSAIFNFSSTKAATPTFSPAAGAYTTAQNVTISSATSGAAIYYTTDGSTPTSASNRYTAPVLVNTATTLSAVAFSPTAANSTVGTASYTFNYQTTTVAPTFSLPAGTYTGEQQLGLSTTTPSATIYYTLDGSTPTTSSTRYTGPLTVSANETVSAIATATGLSQSAVSTAAYVIQSAAGIITTYAGSGSAGYAGDGSPAISALLSGPSRVALDASGNLYIADTGNCVVREVNAATGVITTVAGSICPALPTTPYSGEGKNATVAVLTVADIAVDQNASVLYIADSLHGRVLQVGLSGSTTLTPGIITTAIGDGTPGYNDDGNPGLLTELTSPIALAVDGSGNLYVDDAGLRIRELSATVGGTPGVVSKIAGNGSYAATSYIPNGSVISLPYIKDIAVTPDGSTLYLASALNVVSYTVATNTAKVVAGSDGTSTPTAGIALGNVFSTISSIGLLTTTTTTNNVTTTSSNVYIVDGASSYAYEYYEPAYGSGPTVYLATPDGKLAYSAGTGFPGFTGDGGLAVNADLDFATGIAVAPSGNFYIADSQNQRIRLVTAGTQTVPDPPVFTPVSGSQLNGNSVTIATTAATPSSATIHYTTDGTQPTSASTLYTVPVPVTQGTTFYAITSVGGVDSHVSTATYTFPIAPTPTFSPASCPVNGFEYITIADTASPNVTIYYTLDGTTPTSKSFQYVGHFLISTSTTIKAIAMGAGYTASALGSISYSVNQTPLAPVISPAVGPPSFGVYTTSQQVTITAGEGTNCAAAPIYYTTDGSTPDQTTTPYTTALALSNGQTNLEAISYPPGFPASTITSASYIVNPDMQGVLFENLQGFTSNNLTMSGKYIYLTRGSTTNSSFASYVYRYDTTAGTYTTYAGLSSGAGQSFSNPLGVAADAQGNVYVADYANNRIAKVDTSQNVTKLATVTLPTAVALDTSGNLYVANGTAVYEIASGSSTTTLIAGGGSCSGSNYGDGGPATSACLSGANSIAVSSSGTLYIADSGHYVVRTVQGGTISTVAGTGVSGLSGDLGAAVSAALTPSAIALDSSGNLYIVDYYDDVVRKVTLSTGNINTVVGNPRINQAYDYVLPYTQGPLTEMALYGPTGVVAASDGSLYITSAGSYYINSSTTGFAYGVEQAVFGNVAAKAPTFDTPAGTYTTDKYVTTTTATPGATIQGTINFSGSSCSYQENIVPVAGYYYDPAETYSGGTVNYVVNAPESTTFNVYAAREGYANSSTTTQAYTLNFPQAPTPAITPATNTSYTDAFSATISDAGRVYIYYTVDGVAPNVGCNSSASDVLGYGGSVPIYLPGTTTITTVATGPQLSPSSTATASYTINYPQTAAPTISPGSGNYTSKQTVVLADTDAKAAIYYTTDGSTPVAPTWNNAAPQNGALYTGPITVEQTTKIQAIAVHLYHPVSAIVSGTYTLTTAQGGPLVDFGNVTTGTAATPQTFPVTNTTSSTIGFTGITFSNPTGDFSYTSTCKATLASGATCYGTVNFTPSTTGSRTATLTITTTSSTQPKIVITFTGVGT